ncbi:MAG: sigma factor-like helix-turn-helix DNA-binding protein [bacterium]
MNRDSNRKDAIALSQGAKQRESAVQRDLSRDQHDLRPSRESVVSDLIRELTRRERLVLMLRYTEELTVAEIAAVLEIAATEVERMLESITERVRRRVQPTYGRAVAGMA